MSIYSFSQVWSYTQCPLKYRYKYIDKIKPEEFTDSADTILGSIVHDILEKLYKDINIWKTVSKDDLISYYENKRKEKEDEANKQWWEILIHNQELELKDYKIRWLIYISKYYDDHHPFDDIKVIDTELNVIFDIKEWIKFRGFIDRLDKIWNTFIISDYKTNKNLPSEDKDHYIEQLTLYGIWIKEKYWKYFDSLKAKLYFLHFDIQDERELTEQKLEKVKNKYINIINEIENKKKKFDMWNKKIFEPNKSNLCKRCDYMSICPLFTYINEQDEVVWSLSEKTIKSFVDEFAEIKEKMSKLNEQEKILKQIFEDYITSHPSDTWQYLFQWSEKDLKIKESETYKIVDKDNFIKKIKEIWLYDNISDVAWQKVDKLFKESEEVDMDDFKEIISQDKSYRINILKKK